MTIELRNDERGELDELVGKNCYVHLERMDEHWFCLIVEDGERKVMLNVGTPNQHRRKVNATVYEDCESDLCLDCLFSVAACKCGTSPEPQEGK